MTDTDPILLRMEDQIEWYDKKSITNRKFFLWLRTSMLIAAALIPLVAGMEIAGSEISPIFAGGLGVMVIVLEGLQGLYQFHDNYIRYRSTCEQLKHEKYLFLGKAGQYATVSDPHALLAERVEGLVSQEHAKWTSNRQQSGQTMG